VRINLRCATFDSRPSRYRNIAATLAPGRPTAVLWSHPQTHSFLNASLFSFFLDTRNKDGIIITTTTSATAATKGWYPRDWHSQPEPYPRPEVGVSGGAHALAGQDFHESSAQSLPGAAAEKGHGDPTQQMDEQSHPSDNPFLDTFETSGARTLSVEEQRRLGQRWKAQGRKACSTCGVKHLLLCNPGIVRKRKAGKVKAPWCMNCQEHHLFGQHTRNKQEMATLLTQQAYGTAPIPMPTMSPGEPDAVTEHLSSAEIRTTLIHQVSRQRLW
jgi:hypothetical protein